MHRETAEEYESGIEGILNRLEKQRNMTFGIKLKQKGNDIRLESDHGKDDWHSGTSMDTVCYFCQFLFEVAFLFT